MLLCRLRIAMAVIGIGLGGGYSAWQTFAAAGDEKGHGPPGHPAPTVQLIHPPVRKIVRAIGQPSFIEAYETTPILARRQGYIEKAIGEVGDKVKKGDVLATLHAPGRPTISRPRGQSLNLMKNSSRWRRKWWNWPTPI